MRRLSDKAFIAYAAAATVLIGGLTLLYPADPHPYGLDHGLLRVLLILLIGVVIVVRLAGLAVGLIGSVLAMLALIMLVIVRAPLDLDMVVDILALTIIGGGLALYVGVLGRQAEQAVTGEKRQAHVLDMSVDLVPRALDDDALVRLLESVQAAAGASVVALLVSDGAEVRETSGSGTGGESLSDASRGVARLMLDSYAPPPLAEGHASAAPMPEPLVTSRRDVYIPVISSYGIEGVLFARRQATLRRWQDREVDFLAFAANLIGALIERQYLQKQTARAEAMEEADRLKGNILLSVSHDLKTPIAAATATLTSVLDGMGGEGNAVIMGDLVSVRDDLFALDARVTELIDIARLETSSWKPNVEYNDVGDLCHMVRMATPERQRSRLVLVKAADVPPVRFDLVQVGRALNHIVQNALSYSPEDAPVTIGVTSDENELRVYVQDEGPGLAPGESGQLFEKFFRGSASTRVPRGSGLGLSIAEKIISGHGGRIEVESGPNGTRFTMVLPRTREGSQ